VASSPSHSDEPLFVDDQLDSSRTFLPVASAMETSIQLGSEARWASRMLSATPSPSGLKVTEPPSSDVLESAAEALDGAPFVGDDIGDALRGAGEGSGGEVQDLGRGGAGAAHDLADLLGLVVFGLPAALLLLWAVPPRVRRVRRLNAAARVLALPSEERRRLVAMRAAFSLPYGALLAYTRDPLGDLEAGRYDALVRAELDQAGLRPPPQ